MSLIWKDGTFLDFTLPHIPHNDSGFSNGLGVFDSMIAQDGVPLNPVAHFNRLIHDTQCVLGITPAQLPSLDAFNQTWSCLLSKNNLGEGYARLKTIVTGGVSDKPLGISGIPSIVITATACPSPSPEALPLLRCVVIEKYPRVSGCVLENCKRLDYTRAFAARREAVSMGADEAIVTNTNGNVACGTTSNLFIEENGLLITPPLSEGVLAGTVRAGLLKDGNGKEESISRERLYRAEKIFLTNSFWGMRPVVLMEL